MVIGATSKIAVRIKLREGVCAALRLFGHYCARGIVQSKVQKQVSF